MRTICVALLVVGFGVFVGCKKSVNTTESVQKDKDSPGAPVASQPVKRGTFTVGKSTTYVTVPVTSSGHVDYAAALNERLSKGVTAENNANVAIWKVIGPKLYDLAMIRNGFFEMMGMQTPPANGDYFIRLKQYAEQNGRDADAASEVLNRFSEQPWTANQDAILNDWLVANQTPLNALREAVKRTHYYHPMIPGTDEKGSLGLLSAQLPGGRVYRELALALAARAMLSLSHNQVAEAWQDLLACHRLGRHVGNGAMLIEALIGMSIDVIAGRGDLAFLEASKADAKTFENCLRDLRALPPLPSVVERVNLGERFWTLETIMMLDQYGAAHINRVAGMVKMQPVQSFSDEVLVGIDWNPGLEAVNTGYDRLVDILNEKDRTRRNQQFTKFGEDRNEQGSLLTRGDARAPLRNSGASASARGQAVGEVVFILLTPDGRKVQDAAERITQKHENVITAFALAWYQRSKGQYPVKLADLVPTYLADVPIDLFNGKEPVYQPNANGFMIYSVGVNCRDDDGQGEGDNPLGDDLVVRIPRRAKP